jgi:outer membrane biosynthesis protein TonB
MRDAFYRLTSPILDRIPDITHQPKSRQVSIGLMASLLFHLLLLLFALGVGLVLPGHTKLNFAKPKPKLEEIELTIIPPEPPESAVQLATPAQQQPFMDSTGLTPTDQPVKDAVFQSDANMKAASTLPARGREPVPTQDGVRLPDVAAFAQKPASLGSQPPSPPQEQKTQPETAPPPAEAEVKPLRSEVAEPSDQEVSFPKPAEKTAVAKPKEILPRMRTSALTRDAPLPATIGGKTRNDDVRTKTDGDISDAGADAVQATATDYGRYVSNVRKAIKSRWNFYLEAKAGLTSPGSVRVDFSIDRNGRISNVRSSENTANATYGTICENAVRESQLPPIPQSVIDEQLEERLDLTFRFYHIGRTQF